MDETKKDSNMGHNNMCNCAMCGMGMGHMHGHFGFWVVKLLVALVVLLFVFWLGVKVGEVKSVIGYGRMGRGNMMYIQRGGMTGYGMPGSPVIVPQNMMTTGKATSTPVK